ncbi:octaprenyl diphosphate synthase [Candidatus Regiella insecticola]|uniref:Octaprenyl diphosphate synthase n=1 Tax=Candidatus Regiella insecticola TaxID=138073 RepID=A0A6L2ZM49_9ENTR|nr:octaprenyl diphosphate synthase [Candidatus Regiella insecticola]GFN45504.1 octaprenyl diphosphate synthase [Candidatus Regiella insecticola]
MLNNASILDEVKELTAKDMATVNDTIKEQMRSDVALITEISHYIINNGGKRIRPMIAILVAQALGYKGNQHITIAVLIEFIHTATLLHDDVVDNSDLRRGKATVNAQFGNAASVLVGDFIYTRAFQMMTQLGSMRVLEVMSTATNMIAKGEVQQLINCKDPRITEENYLSVIGSKTAKLFEAASQSSAILAGANKEKELALQRYGHHIGIAFQLIDDLLDYSPENSTGKKSGADLAEGKVTLPLLHAIEKGTPEQTALLCNAIKQGNNHHLFTSVQQVLEECDSLNYTRQCAKTEADKAIAELKVLPETPYRIALEKLAKFFIMREY